MDTKELEAGRVLDAEIHQKVFGATPLDCFEGVYPENRTNPYPGADNDWVKDVVPHYSTDIAAAWQIVERFRVENFKDKPGQLNIEYSSEYNAWFVLLHPNLEYGALADTAPHAICRAALKAVQGK